MRAVTRRSESHRVRRGMPLPAHAWHAILAPAIAACLCSCSTPAPVTDGPPPIPLPLLVSLNLDEISPELAPYGTAEEWRRDILDVFDASNLCLTCRDEKAPDNADVAITLNLHATADAGTEIDVPSAVVTTLAWSCVPPLHLFVRDVAVTPELHATVEWRRAAASPVREIDYRGTFYASYLQRYPFFSWETLGSILVPSFVFSGGERAHLLSSLAGRVRGEAAHAIAKQLRGELTRADDLLRDIELRRTGDAYVLRATPGIDLYTIALRVDDAAPFYDEPQPPVPSTAGTVVEIRFGGTKLPAAPPPRLLRIEAAPRTLDGTPERYTLRIGGDEGTAQGGAR